jgi:hypothetical protein
MQQRPPTCQHGSRRKALPSGRNWTHIWLTCPGSNDVAGVVLEPSWGCATIDFTDIGDLAGTSFVEVSGLGDQRTHLEPEIRSEYCFEGIVGKSPALRKVLEQVAIVAPTDSTVLLTVKQELARS